MTYSEVVYNITGVYVSALSGTSTYGTPSLVKLGQAFNFSFESDTDEIKAYGQFTDALSVVTKATGTISQASLDFATAQILIGLTATDSGSAPNAASTMDMLTGGAGLGYFGAIAKYAATGGGLVVVGFPKCMLATYPSFEQEMNQFRISETDINMYSPSTVIRKVCRIRKFQSAASFTDPTTANDFTNFFAGMFDA